MPEEIAGDPGPAKETPMDLTPTPKVAAAGAGGAASIVLIWVLSLIGVTLPAEVAAAIATLLAFGAGYLKSA
jgi:hypothetical protein